MAGSLWSGKAVQIQTGASWRSPPRSSWWWQPVGQLSESVCWSTWWDPSPQPWCTGERAHPAYTPVSWGTPLFAGALPSGSCAAMPPHHMARRLTSVARQVKPSPGWRISSVSPTHPEVWGSVAQGPASETGHSSGFSCHPLPGSCAGIPGAHWTCPGSARCPAAGCWCYSSAGHYRPAL